MSNRHAVDKPDPPTPRVIPDCFGGSIAIIEEGSATTPMRFRMVMTKGFGPQSERHVSQVELFRVISGVLDLGYVNGKRVELRAGQTFTLPAATLHRPQNRYSEPVEFEPPLTPGLNSAAMFRSLYTTVSTRRGFDMALHLALLFDSHRAEIDFTLPVRIPPRLLARIARLAGGRTD